MKPHIVEKIKNIIDFDEKQVNTKILTRNDEQLALVAAIKKDQLLAEHTSPVDAFVYIIEGEVEFSINEKLNDTEQKDFKIKEGEIFFFKANERHSVFKEASI